MATENITISKASLLKAYREAEPAQKEFLKKLFGSDTFTISFNVMDRVKTFQDAVVELGNDNPLVQQYNQIYSEFGDIIDNDIIGYLKLRIITAALNEGWEPKYTIGECRYYPFFSLLSKAVYDELSNDERQFCYARSSLSTVASGDLVFLAFTGVGSAGMRPCFGARLAFKTRELAKYAGKQFLYLWANFVFKSPDYKYE